MAPAPLSRLDLTRRLVARLEHGEAVVGGIGNSNFDLFGVGDRPENFYMMGSMGLACPIALGVALAQPNRKVFALEGDGSLLMSLGCLATIAWTAPRNLAVIVWDNAQYQITGGQRTATGESTDLVAIARGAGIEQSAWAESAEAFEGLVQQALANDGPQVIAVKVDGTGSTTMPERNAVLLKDRFMRGLGAK